MNSIVTWSLLGESFVTLFVIMDPPGIVPIFLGLVGTKGNAVIKRSAWQATLVSLVVIALFALFGQGILNYLSITVPSLQCAGGLLLLLIALELLTGRAEANHPGHENTVGSVAMVPLGTPLLAGPGAIVTIMVLARRVHDTPDFVGLALGVIGVHIVIYLVMRFSTFVLRLLRPSGVQLVSRIMGLLLAAIAVQMIEGAVRAFINQ